MLKYILCICMYSLQPARNARCCIMLMLMSLGVHILCCCLRVSLSLSLCLVTHTWHRSRPQPTGPSGPPYSAFCSEIIPHCLVLYLPQLRSSLPLPPSPPSPPLNLCDNASSTGVAASRVGRGACQTPMSLSTNAQSAEEAQESRLLLACPR